MMGCGGQNHGVVEVSMRGSKRSTQAAQKICDGQYGWSSKFNWQEIDETAYVATSPAVVPALEEGE